MRQQPAGSCPVKDLYANRTDIVYLILPGVIIITYAVVTIVSVGTKQPVPCSTLHQLTPAYEIASVPRTHRNNKLHC